MKKIRALGTVIFILLFSGCYDANEPNDYAYVVAIGIDKTEEKNEYEISVQFAKPSQISGGAEGQGSTGGETLGIVTVEAPTIYSGINVANNIVSKRFQLSHTKIIVISEEIAKEGIKDIIDTIVRSSDLRPNMYISVAKDSAKEYLASVKPEMEINPVKYYQLIFENDAAEFVPKNVSQNIYFYINSNERDVILPIVSNGEEKSENKGDEKSNDNKEKNIKLPEIDIKTNKEGFEFMMKEYIAGNIIANKKNKSEAMGMAVFDEDKMVGELHDIETELYNIINGTFKTNYNTFYNYKYPDVPMVMQVRQYKPPSIDIKTLKDFPEIYIGISMEGSLISAGGDVLIENDIYNYEEQIEGYIEKAITKFLYKTSIELGTDILGFGIHAKKNFYDYGEFRAYNWNKVYKNSKFSVDVDFTIRRTGLVIKKEEE